jgi:hypothetical protein
MKYYIPVQIKRLDGIQRLYYVQHGYNELSALILLKRKLSGEYKIFTNSIVRF